MSLESKVKFNHETAEAEVARPSYTPGQHFFVVTNAEKQMSKTGDKKPEMQGVYYKMIKLTMKPVRDPADITSVVGRGINVFMCLPFWDEAWDALDYPVQTNDGEVHIKKYLKNLVEGVYMENTREILSGLLPEEVYARPRKISDGVYSFNGEEIGQDQYKENNSVSKAMAGDVAERLWNDGPDELIGKGCFGLIQYKEGSPFPEFKRASATQLIDFKTGEEMPLVERIMSIADGESEESGEAEETPKATKTNGAGGKPKATAKTVAAAAKAKGKPAASKGARR